MRGGYICPTWNVVGVWSLLTCTNVDKCRHIRHIVSSKTSKQKCTAALYRIHTMSVCFRDHLEVHTVEELPLEVRVGTGQGWMVPWVQLDQDREGRAQSDKGGPGKKKIKKIRQTGHRLFKVVVKAQVLFYLYGFYAWTCAAASL